jgi:cytokinin dehydrogenase
MGIFSPSARSVSFNTFDSIFEKIREVTMPTGDNHNSAGLNRRRLLTGLGVAAVIVGFDPIGRRWAVAGASGIFDGVPPLDGELVVDQATRNADSRDNGRYLTTVPSAVLRPGSVQDIEKMIQFCRQHHIAVAARGQAHSTHGQGLTTGLLIESYTLAQVHSISQNTADIDAGATWLDVAESAFQHGLTPPALTGYIGLSVGGVLSMGGVSSTVRVGAVVDHVQQLQVVTGTGETTWCSPSENGELFNAVLAGIGQFAVITRAVVDLVAAKPMVRTYTISYPDFGTLFPDLQTLLDRGELNDVFAQFFPGSTASVYTIQAAVQFDPATPPEDSQLLRGLHVPSTAVQSSDLDYLTYVERVDTVITQFRQSFDWDNLIKPWFDVWLPSSAVANYVGNVVPALTTSDVGPGGFVLLFPQQRAKLTRPSLRLPADDGNEWVYLFDILTTSASIGADRGFVAKMLQRNDDLFAQARALGGVRYPIGSIDFTSADWREHYGSRWPEILASKQKFDPQHILTPGPGIF